MYQIRTRRLGQGREVVPDEAEEIRNEYDETPQTDLRLKFRLLWRTAAKIFPVLFSTPLDFEFKRKNQIFSFSSFHLATM